MYFITPNHSVAFNAKVGSSTLARAIIAAFHPEQEHTIQTAAYPAGIGPDDTQVQWLCPKEKEPTKPVVLVVREPVSRFRTAMAQLRLTDVDEALESLEHDSEISLPRRRRKLRDDAHFRHQHSLIAGGCTAFRLEDLNVAATFIGLSLPLPTINEARAEKPTLTPEQEARVLAYYAADKSLYDSLTPGEGTVVPPMPPEPQPAPAPVILPVPQSISARQARLWLITNGIAMATVDQTIAAIPDALLRERVRVEWEYGTEVHRDSPFVAQLGATLGLTSERLDAAFREAEAM